MRLFTFLLALSILIAPAALSAKPMPTALLGSTTLELPAEVTIIPAVPVTKLLPPSIKEFKPEKFEQAEVAAAKGFWLKPGVASERAKPIYDYLAKSPEFVDSVKLRLLGKKLKASILEKANLQGALKDYAAWYKSNLYAPIPLLIDVGFGSGPAMGPIPCAMEMKGQVKDLYGKYVQNDKFFFSTIMLIEDIKDMFDCSAAMANDTLDLVFCHENAHGIMFDMYGSAMNRIQKVSNVGHDSAVISDRGLAYIEGWAECFEALYGPSNPLMSLKPAEREKYHLSEFLFGRQDPVRRQRYIWAFLEQKTGLLKTGGQILATEGVVAGVFYDLLTSRAIKDPFVKACTVMLLGKPVDMGQFLLGWVKLFPDDKNVLLRVFLENTNYATASNECRGLYFKYYQGKLKYVKKEITAEQFQPLKKAWETEKENVFKQVFDKPESMLANVGNELWLEITAADSKFKGIRMDVNTMDPNLLVALLGLTGDEAMKFVMARSALGAFPGTDPLKALADVLGADKANELATKLALKPLQLNPINDPVRSWLRVTERIPPAAVQRLAEMQK